jgi:hypothetical protein
MLLTPMLLSVGAVAIADAASVGQSDDNPTNTGACHKTADFGALAALPPGLVVGNVDLGPFLLALTPHSVLAAPYHRSVFGIATVHAALSSPPEVARRILTDRKVTYVIVCGPRAPAGLTEAELAASLWARIRAGDAPDWLEAVPELRGSIFAVYRVRPGAMGSLP